MSSQACLHRLALGRLPDSFDGRDCGSGHIADRADTRASRLPVYMHGAGAALGDAAAELRAGHAHEVAQDPQERHVIRRFDGHFRAVNG